MNSKAIARVDAYLSLRAISLKTADRSQYVRWGWLNNQEEARAKGLGIIHEVRNQLANSDATA